MADARSKLKIEPRFRLSRGGELIFGHGKAELLARIRETGSIAKAARRMEMSYMRAWTLVRSVNAACREPAVVMERGGAAQGGATLTRTGEELMKLYLDLTAEGEKVAAAVVHRFGKLLR